MPDRTTQAIDVSLEILPFAERGVCSRTSADAVKATKHERATEPGMRPGGTALNAAGTLDEVRPDSYADTKSYLRAGTCHDLAGWRIRYAPSSRSAPGHDAWGLVK